MPKPIDPQYLTPSPRSGKELATFWKRTMAEFKAHYVPVKAAGIAFFAFFALVPSLVAVISIYGLIADAEEIKQQILDATASLSPEIQNLFASQMEKISGGSGAALGTGIVISILVALFSASGAVKHIISTLNVIYEFPETRNPIKLRLLAYALTLGAAVFAVGAVFVLGILPAVLDAAGVGSAGVWAVNIGRFPLLAFGMIVALSVLFFVAPNREGKGRFRLLTAGAVIATVLWVIVSILFSIYLQNFASYNETYGVFGVIIALLTWMNLTALLVLLGAEVDATRVKLRLEQERARHASTDPPSLIEDGKATQYGKAAFGGILVGAALGALTGKR